MMKNIKTIICGPRDNSPEVLEADIIATYPVDGSADQKLQWANNILDDSNATEVQEGLSDLFFNDNADYLIEVQYA